jgi:hypothetical protein
MPLTPHRWICLGPSAAITGKRPPRVRTVTTVGQNHSNGFSTVWASKPLVTVCEWFGLKTIRTIFAGLASKPVATVSDGLASKPAATVFSSLALKLVVTVSPGLASKSAVGFLVEPQNQGGGGFPGLGLKPGSSGLVIWVSKSPRQFLGLWLKTMWALVCQLRHKIDGGRSTQDASRSSGLLHVEASLARVSQSDMKTGGGATAS